MTNVEHVTLYTRGRMGELWGFEKNWFEIKLFSILEFKNMFFFK